MEDNSEVERLARELLELSPIVIKQYLDGNITAIEASTWVSNKLLNYALTTGQL